MSKPKRHYKKISVNIQIIDLDRFREDLSSQELIDSICQDGTLLRVWDNKLHRHVVIPNPSVERLRNLLDASNSEAQGAPTHQTKGL